MDTKQNIEKLFNEQFQDYRPEPSQELWPKLRRQLKWRRFIRPRLDSFNIAYLSVIILGTAITVFVLNNNNIADLQETENLANGIEDTRSESNATLELLDKTYQDNISDSSPEKSLTKSSLVNQDSESNTNKQSSVLNKDDQAISIDNQNPSNGSGRRPVTSTLRQAQDGARQQAPSNQLPPRAFFIPTCDNGCAPLHLTFTNLSSEAVEYTWSFGDGGQSAENNPSYIFDDAGEYFVTLTAKNENEEISVYTNVITVHRIPEASFMIEKQKGMSEYIPVYFYNYSKGADNYSWEFGDGTKSTESNPSHVYEVLGDYDIKLQATSHEGCIDSMILSNALNRENPIIRIPNAFSPNTGGSNGGYYSNGENSNEVFHPVFGQAPIEYQLRIFNRNGNLLFESDDLNIGWDGYFMQQLQPRGVYIYKLRVKFENGEYIDRIGDVTVYIQD